MTAITPAKGNVYEVTVKVEAGTAAFKPTAVLRLWPEKPE